MKVCRKYDRNVYRITAGLKGHLLPLFLACSMLLTGCQLKDASESSKSEQPDQNLTWGMTPSFDYEVPVERPVILVDPRGYYEKSTKNAFFEAKNAPTGFSVLEKATDTVVYTGEVVLKENVGYIGTFTELQTPGEYYIRSDGIGCSYYFKIGNDSFSDTEGLLKKKLEENQELLPREMDTGEVCDVLGYLLMGYEIYPQLYSECWNDSENEKESIGEDTEISAKPFFAFLQNYTNCLLAMQDSVSGGVYGGLVPTTGSRAGESQENPDGQMLKEISAESTACFSAVMAKFGYLFQQYDVNYATTCLKASAKAWKYLENIEKEGNTVSPDLICKKFLAASELYRASNDERYHMYIKQNQEPILSNQEDMYGWIGKCTYLSTRRKVDKGMCDRMMSDFLKKAEQISGQSKQNPYFIRSEEIDQILNDMTIMGIVDYVITNHEYSTVIENHIHYCLGRNSKSVDYSLGLSARDSARFLFLFSAVAKEENLME